MKANTIVILSALISALAHGGQAKASQIPVHLDMSFKQDGKIVSSPQVDLLPGARGTVSAGNQFTWEVRPKRLAPRKKGESADYRIDLIFSEIRNGVKQELSHPTLTVPEGGSALLIESKGLAQPITLALTLHAGKLTAGNAGPEARHVRVETPGLNVSKAEKAPAPISPSKPEIYPATVDEE